MSVKKRAEAAVEYKHNGYNCCQAVIMAYLDILNTDKELLMNTASGFGTGMGCAEATCGSICGAVIAAGIMRKGENTKAYAKEILKNFEQKSGATICKDLKGIETGKMLCSCDDCVRNGVLALSEVLMPESV